MQSTQERQGSEEDCLGHVLALSSSAAIQIALTDTTDALRRGPKQVDSSTKSMTHHTMTSMERTTFVGLHWEDAF